jgi:hypothetical protein
MKRAFTKCVDCKWWNPLSDDKSQPPLGECRRYPPSVYFTGLVYHKYCKVSEKGFPLTANDCWCGEIHY